MLEASALRHIIESSLQVQENLRRQGICPDFFEPSHHLTNLIGFTGAPVSPVTTLVPLGSSVYCTLWS